MATPNNIQGTPEAAEAAYLEAKEADKAAEAKEIKEIAEAKEADKEAPFDFAAYLATLSPEDQQKVVTNGLRVLDAETRKDVAKEARVSAEDAEAKVARAKEVEGRAKDELAIDGKTIDDLINADFRPSTLDEMVYVIRYTFTPNDTVKEQRGWQPFAKAKGSGATGEHRTVLQERVIFPMALVDDKGQIWGVGEKKDHGIPALCAKLGIVVDGDSAPRKLAKAMLKNNKGYGLTYDGKDALIRVKDAKKLGLLGARKK